MAWESLPPIIVEKIVYFAALADYEETKDEYLVNIWALGVYNYGIGVAKLAWNIKFRF